MRRETKDRITVSRSRNLALAAVFGALYSALVIGFAPISNLPIQVRVADALMPLAILFGWPAILGLGIGTVVGNFAADSITGFPSASIGLDIAGGSFVNLLTGFLAWKIGQRGWKIRNWNMSWFVATLVETALISVVVGGYLSVAFSIPLALSILGILAGEVVAINIGGFVLLNIIGRARSLDLFKSWGLQIYETNRNQ
ncbi:QueT transporter family protein [Candidatus Bathyarchaeota archaeon]|nr:MAG: QueT transporter family protein [Candidatus Bathyarchaeota archaeon]TMI53507.1 MAG: QueT transporter family protein [Candidatus Bathyarchaeota archaeon]